MAIMIPDTPREHTENSLEGEIFETFKKLPDTYVVIHSYNSVYVKDNIQHERETDFLIFHPKLGIICVEAKAGHIKYEYGQWLYANDTKMKKMNYDGPYDQVQSFKSHLIASIYNNNKLRNILNRCKILHCVWFPSITREYFNKLSLPAEADPAITLTKESFENLEQDLKKIYDIGLIRDPKTGKMRETKLSDNDVKLLIKELICPEFQLSPSNNFLIDIKKISFNRLLEEQYQLLNYLTYQRTAVINGAAGTGKTMIAVEKAMRHSRAGEKVLFLCYNAFLRDFLLENHKDPNVEFKTIAELACSLCRTSEPDYQRAEEIITELYCDGAFPYKHIIIDEGQDFGSEQIEETNILQTLHDIVVSDSDKKSTFYVFYDALQLVQAKSIPKYIADADCKLTLYKNCRNTRSIADTSLQPISERTPELFDGAITGNPPQFHFVLEPKKEVDKVKSILRELKEEGHTDIAVLTCTTESRSVLSGETNSSEFKNVMFTSCRKYKGLQADAVILVDVSEKTFTVDPMIFYVGSSRARIRLDIVTTMDDAQCTRVLTDVLHFDRTIKKPKKHLADRLKGIPDIETE